MVQKDFFDVRDFEFYSLILVPLVVNVPTKPLESMSWFDLATVGEQIEQLSSAIG